MVYAVEEGVALKERRMFESIGRRGGVEAPFLSSQLVSVDIPIRERWNTVKKKATRLDCRHQIERNRYLPLEIHNHNSSLFLTYFILLRIPLSLRLGYLSHRQR